MGKDFAIAVKCVAVCDNKVLVLTKTDEEKKGDESDNNLDLPGGRVNYGEQPDTAMIRELREETGLEPKNYNLKSASSVIRPDGTHLVILLYKCECRDINVKLSSEHSSYKWLDRSLCNYGLPDWIKSAIEKAFDDPSAKKLIDTNRAHSLL